EAVKWARCRYALGAPVTAAIAQIAEGDRQYHLVGLASLVDEIEAAGVTGQFAARDVVGVFGGWLTVLRMTEPHRWRVGRDRDDRRLVGRLRRDRAAGGFLDRQRLEH